MIGIQIDKHISKQNQKKTMNNLQLIPTIDWLFDEHFHSSTSNRLSSRIVSKVEDGKLEIAVSVLGHDPKNVSVELTEDRIFIKSEPNKDDKSVSSVLVQNIDDVLKLSKDYNGLSAKATIKDGILSITVDKKEEAKPKKLSIKF